MNRTRSSTIDFEIMQRKLRSSIRGSGLAREYFLVVENRQRMDREKDRITGPGQPDRPPDRQTHQTHSSAGRPGEPGTQVG